MSSFTFTPSDTMDPKQERDWAAHLGMLDWDSTRIVFTKRSLIEFLKYTGTTVDTNFSNIQKVPRYAQFGKVSAVEIQEPSKLPESSSASEEATVASGAPKPAGGIRGHTDIFGNGVDDDALSTAPAKDADVSGLPAPEIKPSRRVRTAPGGLDSISGLFGNDASDTFKPTRRVKTGSRW